MSIYVVSWDSISGKRAKQMVRGSKFADELAGFARSRGRTNIKVEKWVKPTGRSGRYGPYKIESHADDRKAELDTAGYITRKNRTASGYYVHYRKVNW